MPPPHTQRDLGDARRVAHNLRRLMARFDLTYEQVVEASGLDERTVRSIALGRTRPHARRNDTVVRGETPTRAG